MGTRHLIGVVSNGDVKVAQYGQWDGYPSGQGETVQNFLLSTDLEAFKKNVDQCSFLTDKEKEEIQKNKDWPTEYPYLSRDTGAEILSKVADSPLKLVNNWDFAADSLFCEFAYILDLDRSTLEIYKGFNKSPVPFGQRFSEMKPEKENSDYYPITLLKEIPFSEITESTMDDLENELRNDEEED